MNKIYLVCEKVFVDDVLYACYVLKVYRDLDNARDRLQKEVELLVAGDSKWTTDTNGVNYIDMTQYGWKRHYYIIERFVED